MNVSGGGEHALTPMAQTHLRGVTSSTSLSTTYTWTTENRLAGVTRSDAKSYGYTYDYRIRRVGTVSEESGQAAKHTAILFSGGLSVAEYEGSTLQTQITTPTVNTVSYVRGPDMGGGVGGLLYSTRTETGGDKKVRYNLSNGRGDIVAQSDESATLTWTASYEAYGKRPTETGENLDKQRANSKDEDPTGLLNEGFRYRDIETGVWLSRDPAGFVDGPNLYAYVKQNPWTAWDPLGLKNKQDHRNDKATAQQTYEKEVAALGKNAGWGEELAARGRRNIKWEASDKAIAAIEKTASDIHYFSGQVVDSESLDDESANYKSFTRSVAFFRANPEHQTVEALSAGRYGEAAKRIGISAAFALAGGKLFQGTGATVTRGVAGSAEGRLLPGGTGRAFAGHGVEEGFEGGFGQVIIPEGTSLMIPGRKGLGMPDALGRAIESGNWDAISANPQWFSLMEGSATHLPGSSVPNLMLTPAGNLNMLQNSIRVTTPTPLSEMLKPGMGPLDWAACRQVF